MKAQHTHRGRLSRQPSWQLVCVCVCVCAIACVTWEHRMIKTNTFSQGNREIALYARSQLLRHTVQWESSGKGILLEIKVSFQCVCSESVATKLTTIHWHNTGDDMSQFEIWSVKWFNLTLSHIPWYRTRAHTHTQLNITKRRFLVRLISHFLCTSHKTQQTNFSDMCMWFNTSFK